MQEPDERWLPLLPITAHYLPRKLLYHCHQLINCLITVTGLDRTLHAAMGMALQQQHGHRIQRGLQRGHLVEDVNAIAVFRYHLVDAAHLALDAVEALNQRLLIWLDHCAGRMAWFLSSWRLQNP